MVLCLLVLSEARTITIDSDSTLGMEHYLCNAADELEPNTTIEINASIYYLDEGPMCTIENVADLTIRGVGESGKPSTIYCHGDNYVLRGFMFINVTNLLIENVWVENCGTTIPNDLPAGTNDTYIYFGPGQKAVFLFSHCTDVRLKTVIINRSFGFGVLAINIMGTTEASGLIIKHTNTRDHVNCVGATFIYDLSCSGSGAVFIYGDDVLTDATGQNGTLRISNSVFLNNTNYLPIQFYLPLYTTLRSPYETARMFLGGSTGLSIFTGQLGYHVDAHFDGVIVENNEGPLGGASITYYNSVRNSVFFMKNSYFGLNYALSPSRGGALIVIVALFLDRLNSFPEYPNDIYDLLHIKDSGFYGNFADQGGAIYFHLAPQNVTDYRFTIENTTFVKNVASAGSAIEAASIKSSFVTRSAHIVLQDIEAYYNTFPEAIITGSDTIKDSAIFVFYQISNVTIMGKSDHGSRFYNNTPGVVLASGGNVVLRGHVTFEDNFGFTGGALSIYDNAILFLHEGSSLHFKRNRALQSGGAIFANTLGTGIADACVIQIIGPSRIFEASQVHLLDLDLLFEDNVAEQAGNSIHANPLYNCEYLPESSIQYSTAFGAEPGVLEDFADYAAAIDGRIGLIYEAIFNFKSTADNGIREITSVPTRLCICNETGFSVSFCDQFFQVLPVTTFPGKTFTIHLVAVDRVTTPVASLVYAEVETDDKNDDITLAPAQNVRQISGKNCTHVDFTLYGPDNTNTLINLYASPGGLPVTLNVSIEPCPPGFQLETINGLLQCACNDFITDHVIDTTCNTTSYTIARPENTWLGILGDPDEAKEVAYISTCPINYCKDGITEVNLSIPDQLCENGRSGILCGECEASRSVIFGSAECSDCSSLWLLTIPLYAIAGVLLVFLLFLLDLTVTKGTINGLILYVNIVSVNANIFFRGSGGGQYFFFVFISLLNLELGFPICFFDGMGETAKVGFQFVFPAYLMVLCGGIIYLSRWSRRMQKICSSSGVQVLATLIYLSYAKILRTVIDILSFATLRSSYPNNPHISHNTIWLFDGNVHYLEGVHILLFMAAIVVILAFVLPYTFSLALVVLIQRSSRFTPRLKPVIDAYLGPYKDKCRYWFGLRLVVLLAMCVTYAILGTDDPGLALLIQLLFLVLFAHFQGFMRPYKNLAIELLDIFFLENFIILALASSHIIHDTNDDHDKKQEAAVDVMTGLAFMVFLGIISYHILTKLRQISSFKEKTDKLYAEITKKRRRFTLNNKKVNVPTVTSTEVVTEMTDRVTTTSATSGSSLSSGTPRSGTPKSGNTYRSTEVGFTDSESAPDDFRPHKATFSQLREPILDMLST